MTPNHWKHPPRKPQGNGNIRAILGGVVVASLMLIGTGWL